MLKDWFAAISSWLSKPTSVEDGPPDELYRPYTTKFDLEVDAKELHRIISEASPDKSRGWLEAGDYAWNAAIQASKTIYEKYSAQAEDFTSAIPKVPIKGNSTDVIVSILVDQSGSMKGNSIAQAAAASRMLVEALLSHDMKVELLGFSTAGWHGGFARRLWKSTGQPSRPGRLCALMHVIYKSADEPTFSEERWHAMLDPNLLRENLDGEAILWAVSRLQCRPEQRKILVVISDGAPVDDSTLTQNGPSYLEKHLLSVIHAIESDTAVELYAIGIGYEVNRYYPQSVTIDEADKLPDAIRELLIKLFGN